MNNYYFHNRQYIILLIILSIVTTPHLQASDNKVDKKISLINNQYDIVRKYFPGLNTVITGSAALFLMRNNHIDEEKENIIITEENFPMPNDTDFVVESNCLKPLLNIGDYKNNGCPFRTSTSLSNATGESIDIIREDKKVNYIDLNGLNVISPKELIKNYECQIENGSYKSEAHKKKVEILKELTPAYKHHMSRKETKKRVPGSRNHSNSQMRSDCEESTAKKRKTQRKLLFI